MKTKLMSLLWACLVMTTASFMACSEDDDVGKGPSTEPGTEEVATPPTVDVTVVMKAATVEGTVRDTDGNPLSGVSVTSGESTTTTDARGNFIFRRVADASGRFVLTFAKEGYFGITRSGLFEENLSMQVVMQSKQGSNTVTTSFNAGKNNTLEAEGMKVNIPASSLVTLDGRAYTGTVRAEMLYLSPENDNFSTMMPGGDMAAVRNDESNATLLSYGMVEVSLSDQRGNKLQLRNGDKSEMTFPIPENMKDNPPATIPLWYFDEGSGLWVEEGEATLQGDVYVGTVSHFSWHNLDVPAERVTITGQVTDCEGRPVSRVLVTVDQTSAMTNANGRYTVYVPENTPVTVTVNSEDYFNYQPVASLPVPGQPGGTTVEGADLSLPCVPLVIGRVRNSCGDLTIASIWCEYTWNGSKQTTEVAYTNAATGDFTLRIPMGVTGQATLYVEPVGGEIITKKITLDGSDLTVEIELCQNIEEDGQNVLLIKDKNGKTLQTIVLDETNVVFGFANNAFAFTAPIQGVEGLFQMAAENYDDTATSSDNITVAAWANLESTGSYVFACENGHIDILSRTETEATINVLANGSYADGTGEQEATLSGIVHGNMTFESDYKTNVTDWSALKCASAVPQLKLPVDLVAEINLMGMEIEALYYKDGDMSDVEAMGKILEADGWSIMSEETNDESYTVTYMNGSFQMVSFNFDARGQEAPDGNLYKLMVVPMI